MTDISHARLMFQISAPEFLKIAKVDFANHGRGAVVVHLAIGSEALITYLTYPELVSLLTTLNLKNADMVKTAAMAYIDQYDPEREFVVFVLAPAADGFTDVETGIIEAVVK